MHIFRTLANLRRLLKLSKLWPNLIVPDLKPKSFVLNLLMCCPDGQSGPPSRQHARCLQ